MTHANSSRDNLWTIIRTISALVSAVALSFIALELRPSTLGLGPIGALHAALLSNGQVYYGVLKEADSQHIVLERVFYVQSTVDPQTQQAINKLVDRARSDWHGPTQMSLPKDKIMFVEVVGPDSQVSKLIAEAVRRTAAEPR